MWERFFIASVSVPRVILAVAVAMWALSYGEPLCSPVRIANGTGHMFGSADGAVYYSRFSTPMWDGNRLVRVPQRWEALGFSVTRDEFPDGKKEMVVAVPWWLLTAFAALPWVRLAARERAESRRLWRRQRGLCAECGYDVRASATTCPECGEPKP